MTPERKRSTIGLVSAAVVSVPLLWLALYVATPLVGVAAAIWGVLCGYLIGRRPSPSTAWILPWGLVLVGLPLVPALIIDHWWPGGALTSLMLCSLVALVLGYLRTRNEEHASKDSPQ